MSNVTLKHGADTVSGGDLAKAPDNELLQIYISRRDPAAAGVLIHRYAAMVATVCRATVSDYQAAEDAFQITFSVFLQSAGSIRAVTSVGAWLHSVAYRSACRVRKKLMRNGHTELDPENLPNALLDHGSDPATLIARQVELETLSEELERLPRQLRAAIVEHHLLGRSAPAIARELDVALTTVEGRLRRGRQQLRRRLASRGISMSTLIASSRFMQLNVTGCDATKWTQTFVQCGLSLRTGIRDQNTSEDRATLKKSDLLEISSQLSKEFNLIGTTSWKLVSGIALACGVGITAASLAASGIGGQPSQRISNAKVTLESKPAAGSPAQMRSLRTPAPRAEDTLQVAAVWKRPEDPFVPRWARGNTEEEQAAAFFEFAQEKLSLKVDASYPGQPLQTVLASMADQVEIPIWINVAELEAVGLAVDTPVTLDLPKQITVRSAIRMMLAPLELTYIPRNEVLEITSIDDAEADLMTHEYDLAYFLPNSSNVKAIHKLIHYSIHPDSWAIFGGDGSIVQIGSLMVVSARYSTHEGVQNLLSKLSRMNPSNALQSSDFDTFDEILAQPTAAPAPNRR